MRLHAACSSIQPHHGEIRNRLYPFYPYGESNADRVNAVTIRISPVRHDWSLLDTKACITYRVSLANRLGEHRLSIRKLQIRWPLDRRKSKLIRPKHIWKMTIIKYEMPFSVYLCQENERRACRFSGVGRYRNLHSSNPLGVLIETRICISNCIYKCWIEYIGIH